MIAVLLPTPIEGIVWSEEPFHMPLLCGIERHASENLFDIVLCIRTDPVPNFILEKRVDGVICVGTVIDYPQRVRILEVCAEKDIPAMTLTANYGGTHSLMPAEREGVRQAVAHLAELGHRQIAYLGLYPDWIGAQERLAGYCAGLEGCGLAIRQELIEATLKGVNPNRGYDGMSRLLTRRPETTAVVCYNDNLAMGAVRYLEEVGLQVPADVSVVGFDDISIQLGFHPALTSVGVDRHAMGARAMQFLMEQIDVKADEDEEREPVHETFPVCLVARESTAPPRASE
jgi:DNA-binding LacI/PurR family transcriptional regulator